MELSKDEGKTERKQESYTYHSNWTTLNEQIEYGICKRIDASWMGHAQMKNNASIQSPKPQRDVELL